MRKNKTTKRKCDDKQREGDAKQRNCKTTTCQNPHFCFCCLCRPPNNTTQFWEDLQESIDNVKQAGYEIIIIAGDLNADPNTFKTQWNKLQYLCGSNYLKTCISEVTRLTATSATTLDQILISKNLPICNYIYFSLLG